LLTRTSRSVRLCSPDSRLFAAYPARPPAFRQHTGPDSRDQRASASWSRPNRHEHTRTTSNRRPRPQLLTSATERTPSADQTDARRRGRSARTPRPRPTIAGQQRPNACAGGTAPYYPCAMKSVNLTPLSASLVAEESIGSWARAATSP